MIQLKNAEPFKAYDTDSKDGILIPTTKYYNDMTKYSLAVYPSLLQVVTWGDGNELEPTDAFDMSKMKNLLFKSIFSNRFIHVGFSLKQTMEVLEDAMKGGVFSHD